MEGLHRVLTLQHIVLAISRDLNRDRYYGTMTYFAVLIVQASQHLLIVILALYPTQTRWCMYCMAVAREKGKISRTRIKNTHLFFFSLFKLPDTYGLGYRTLITSETWQIRRQHLRLEREIELRTQLRASGLSRVTSIST